ncbi:MAG: thermonuclease family protein [Hyphomicrobiaceae bacterium]|nr:thermonuclease family protein [Hyphomicrobiaceae bacterium]
MAVFATSAGLWSSAGSAEDVITISGPARVLDADILIVGNQRVILWGIDAPERGQTCILDARMWGCYDAAKRLLETLAARGNLDCYLVGDPDPFNRYYGVCEFNGEDIGAEMVRQGMALAYSTQTSDYEAVQLEAITAGKGLWQPGAQFQEPWLWRIQHTPGGYR